MSKYHLKNHLCRQSVCVGRNQSLCVISETIKSICGNRIAPMPFLTSPSTDVSDIYSNSFAPSKIDIKFPQIFSRSHHFLLIGISLRTKPKTNFLRTDLRLKQKNIYVGINKFSNRISLTQSQL